MARRARTQATRARMHVHTLQPLFKYNIIVVDDDNDEDSNDYYHTTSCPLSLLYTSSIVPSSTLPTPITIVAASYRKHSALQPRLLESIVCERRRYSYIFRDGAHTQARWVRISILLHMKKGRETSKEKEKKSNKKSRKKWNTFYRFIYCILVYIYTIYNNKIIDRLYSIVPSIYTYSRNSSAA